MATTLTSSLEGLLTGYDESVADIIRDEVLQAIRKEVKAELKKHEDVIRGAVTAATGRFTRPEMTLKIYQAMLKEMV